MPDTPPLQRSDRCPKSLSGSHIWVDAKGRLDLYQNMPSGHVHESHCLSCGTYRQQVIRADGTRMEVQE
jgi:hypothetical protein